MVNGKLNIYLKQRRTKLQLTLRQVEAATGIQNAYLSQLENGKITKPSPAVLHKLADPYQLPYEMLLEMAGHPVPFRKTDSSVSNRLPDELSTLTNEEEDKLLEYLRFLRSQEKR